MSVITNSGRLPDLAVEGLGIFDHFGSSRLGISTFDFGLACCWLCPEVESRSRLLESMSRSLGLIPLSLGLDSQQHPAR